MIATIHDEAEVNYAAMEALHVSGDLTNALFGHCLSHALSNAGKQMQSLLVHEFLCHWNQLISHSTLAQRVYLDQLGHSAPRLTNSVRWYVEWEEIRDLFRDSKGDRLRNFLNFFITQRGKDAPPSASWCRNTLQNANIHQLLYEMLVITQHGRPLCKACYFLEGDGFLWPYAATKLEQCLASLDPAVPLTQNEATYVRNFAALMGVQFDDVTRNIWAQTRNTILLPAHNWLSDIMPPTEPAPTAGMRNKVLSRYFPSLLFFLPFFIQGIDTLPGSLLSFRDFYYRKRCCCATPPLPSPS